MAAHQETGEMDAVMFETREMDAIRGGDADTGVEFPRATDGATATSGQVEVEPVAEGQQFPSANTYWGD